MSLNFALHMFICLCPLPADITIFAAADESLWWCLSQSDFHMASSVSNKRVSNFPRVVMTTTFPLFPVFPIIIGQYFPKNKVLVVPGAGTRAPLGRMRTLFRVKRTVQSSIIGRGIDLFDGSGWLPATCSSLPYEKFLFS